MVKESEKIPFFAYVDTFEGKKLAGSFDIVVSAREVIHPRTNTKTWDPQGQVVAKFVGGCCVVDTDSKDAKEIIKFLDAYNENNIHAAYKVTRERISENGNKIEVKTQKVIPLSLVKLLDIGQLKKLLSDEFDYTSKGDTAKEIIEEATQKGFFV